MKVNQVDLTMPNTSIRMAGEEIVEGKARANVDDGRFADLIKIRRGREQMPFPANLDPFSSQVTKEHRHTHNLTCLKNIATKVCCLMYSPNNYALFTCTSTVSHCFSLEEKAALISLRIWEAFR